MDATIFLPPRPYLVEHSVAYIKTSAKNITKTKNQCGVVLEICFAEKDKKLSATFDIKITTVY